MWGHREKTGIYELWIPRWTPNVPVPWFWISSLQNCEKSLSVINSQTTEFSYSSPNTLRRHTFEKHYGSCAQKYFPVIEVTANILSCLLVLLFVTGLPRWHSGTESAWQCRRYKRRRFDPWVGKIPWRRKWQPTTLLLTGNFPWIEEPGRLQPMGSQRVRHDWATKHADIL